MGIEVTTPTIRIRDSALSLIVELKSSSDLRASNTLSQERQISIVAIGLVARGIVVGDRKEALVVGDRKEALVVGIVSPPFEYVAMSKPES